MSSAGVVRPSGQPRAREPETAKIFACDSAHRRDDVCDMQLPHSSSGGDKWPPLLQCVAESAWRRRELFGLPHGAGQSRSQVFQGTTTAETSYSS